MSRPFARLIVPTLALLAACSPSPDALSEDAGLERRAPTVTLCHATGSGASTLVVALSAAEAHLRHGDTLGRCDPSDADGDGVSTADGDCDDADPSAHPGAAEVCDGIDQDCDGVVDGDGVCEEPIRDVVFEAVGADQSFIVPAGVTRVEVEAWGAGGAGGGVSGRVGGGGGYAAGSIDVAPGEVLVIVVGDGGIRGSAALTYGGGGGAGVLSGPENGCVGGSGGGRSAVRVGADEVLTAGGGGGAGDCSGQGDGGAGGGLEGASGTGPYPGGGGTQSAGGAAGPGGEPGAAFTGGSAINDGGAGGGGGGGWFGGGGASGVFRDSGGGGGSGFVDGVSAGVTEVGWGSTPARSSDEDHLPGVGLGGGAAGGPGQVVVHY